MVTFRIPRLIVVFALAFAYEILAFNNSRNDNLAVYWGQNSYGATHSSNTANWQQTLSTYCQDDTIDAIPLAFLDVFFSTGGEPEIDFANTCNSVDNAVFAGTNLANCQFLASDIETCQAKGKIVTLSLGGATGAAGFTNDSQAEAFADTIWNLFLGGSSPIRPLGPAILDGVDLDIEGGSSNGFAAFVTRIRSHASGASKPYYVTAAPQCPFPDAYLGTVINAVGFDAIYVQFYNNYCSLPNFNNTNDWDFSSWDSWAKDTSPNPNVKIYIGAPASSTAAGSGYVDATTLGSIAINTHAQYSSFGGVMLWDASQAYANNRFDLAVKAELTGSAPPASTTTASTTQSTTTTRSTTITTSTSTSSGGSGSCAGVPAWQSSVAYQGGQQVTYNGHLWQAKWWSEGDAPGGSAGDWADEGSCNIAATGAAIEAGVASAKVTSAKAVVTNSPKVTAGSKNSRFFKF